MPVKVGQSIELRADKRYIQHTREQAISDVYDALVELITNADDSYNRLFRRKQRERDGGDILIQYLEQRKGQPSLIIVRDRAEGMDSRDMENSLTRMGAYSSEFGNRGYMGRGAKDCTALGELIFESIKNDKYYRCKITHDLRFVLEVDKRKATPDDREKLGVIRGNGTVVTLKLNQGVRLPRFEYLRTELPWHFALRDIMSEESGSIVLLEKLNSSEKPVRLVYRPPEGKLVIGESYNNLEEYPVATAQFRLWKADEPIAESKSGSRFERFGILIKGTRAIHECSLLTDEFKADPHARNYFGRLECPYVDKLFSDYESERARNLPHPPANPRLVIDPNRRFGIERDHPFARVLFQNPTERLRSLIAKDKQRDKQERCEIANQDTKRRLSRLAKLAGRFLRQQLDELEELSVGEAADHDSFARQGILIYPTYLNVKVESEITLTVYVQRSLLTNESNPVVVETDSPHALEIIGSPLLLHQHRTKEDRLLGSFKIIGKQICEDAILTVHCYALPTAQALVQIVESSQQSRDFNLPLEFEKEQYSVRQGSRKKIRLFARYPEIVAQAIDTTVTSVDSNKVAVIGRCKLIPVIGSNYAEGIVTVEGRKLKSRAVITAEVNNRVANTGVKVIDKAEASPTVPLEFDIRDEEYGSYRAIWAVYEGKPNLLLISGKHKSLARYLGQPPFPGQNSLLFRLLIAEIVAESVCRKALTMEAKERPWDFRWAELKKEYDIAENVLFRMQQRLNDFVAIAHAEMISDKDISSQVFEEA